MQSVCLTNYFTLRLMKKYQQAILLKNNKLQRGYFMIPPLHNRWNRRRIK
jgi:hypothetical protein